MAKTIRTRIGSKYADLLPMGGLTAREFNGKAKWDAMTPIQRQAMAEGRSIGFDRLRLKALDKIEKAPEKSAL